LSHVEVIRRCVAGRLARQEQEMRRHSIHDVREDGVDAVDEGNVHDKLQLHRYQRYTLFCGILCFE